jgi:hypothetical protein
MEHVVLYLQARNGSLVGERNVLLFVAADVLGVGDKVVYAACAQLVRDRLGFSFL